ncbi:MAG TPA: PorV/PorQ family protein [bacterium]|nr:PorV/PorQ family protein [bacterium]HPQ19035.1 PorV/PorQ family protein [bacterium]
MKKFFALNIFIIICYFSLLASNYTGKNTATFLRLIPDAKSAALGRAFTGLADNEAAAYFNPAALSFLKYNSLAFSHHQLFEDIKKEFLTYYFKTSEFPLSFALSGLYINYGDIKKTTYTQPDGIGYFSANEAYIMLSISQMVDKNFSLGANLKILRSKIDTYRDEAFAGDISFFYKLYDEYLQIGGGIYNIGTKLTMYKIAEPLPKLYRLGFASSLIENHLIVTFDFFKVYNEKLQFGIGTELKFNKIFALRAGYNSENDLGSGLSIGCGLNFDYLRFDYAYEPYSDVDDVHYFTIALEFGKPEEKKTSKKEEIKESAPQPIYIPLAPVQTREVKPEQVKKEPPIYQAPAPQIQQPIIIPLLPQEKPISADKEKEFQLHSYFAKLYFEQGNFEDALLEVKLANEIKTTLENIKLEFKILLKLKFFDEANDLFKKYIEIFPELKREINK